MVTSVVRTRLAELIHQWMPRAVIPEAAADDAVDNESEAVAAAGVEPPPVSARPESGVWRPVRPLDAGDGGPPWWSRLAPPGLPSSRLRALGLGLAALLLVVGWWWWQGRPQPVTVAPQIVSPGVSTIGAPSGSTVGSTPGAVAGGMVVVHVTGPVRRPGIVEVPSGSRVIDAIEAAGGLRQGADYGAINLARPLLDGEQIIVGVEAGAGATGGAPVRLSLNQATAADLEELPGVGPVLAARIIEWRDRNGGFRSLDELREVSGIGDATFADLSPLLIAP